MNEMERLSLRKQGNEIKQGDDGGLQASNWGCQSADSGHHITISNISADIKEEKDGKSGGNVIFS